MREIKFRAWDRNYSCIYDWGEICIESAQIFITDGDLRYSSKDESLVLMQYTGLKDKNGKEVYEGDIVKDWENIDLYEVVWNRRYACFELNRLTFGNDTGQEIDNSHLDLEIIGNIYENKDLLEAKEI